MSNQKTMLVVASGTLVSTMMGSWFFLFYFLSVNGSVCGNSRGQSKHQLDKIEWNIKEDVERVLGEVG